MSPNINNLILWLKIGMSKPWTFALLKPDAVANPISIRWFLDAIFQKGLVINEGCRMILPQEKASRLYSMHQNSFFYSRLIRHICSGPIVAMRLEFHGWNEDASSSFAEDEAIKEWRELLGPSKLFANIYKIECKEPGDIRWRNFRQFFALSDTRNFGHGADTMESLQAEYAIFKEHMKKIDDPAVELFHLDRYMLVFDEIDEKKEKVWNKTIN